MAAVNFTLLNCLPNNLPEFILATDLSILYSALRNITSVTKKHFCIQILVNYKFVLLSNPNINVQKKTPSVVLIKYLTLIVSVVGLHCCRSSVIYSWLPRLVITTKKLY